MIDVAGLSKYYAGHRAINDITFSIGEGEIVGLLGLNGAGKSTILKILGCFLLPSAGQASVAGYSVEDEPHAIRALIGYLPDTPPLYDEMRVLDYLRFVAKVKNVAPRDVHDRVSEVMGFTNIHDVQDSTLRSLSHGYRQRVGIAQALVHRPKVLILDEPINGLDPVQIVEMRDLILSLRGKHTVILSSHILSEITKTCDRILIVDKGRLVAEGNEQMLERQALHTMRLSCEVANVSTALVEALKSLKGVKSVSNKAATGSGQRLVLETEGDLRAAIAALIVQKGGGLLELARDEAGLENVFMRLVNPGSQSRH